MNSTRLLVLFDIDGTLLISHGIGRKAIRHALLEVFGIEGALDSQKVGGRSYREIVAGALGGTGITADQISSRWEPFNRAVEQAMREPINQKPGLITALPGGLRLIEVLSSDSCVITGLLTGNPPGVSRLKLESAGYSMQSFQVAVFGDDAETPPADGGPGSAAGAGTIWTGLLWTPNDTGRGHRLRHRIRPADECPLADRPDRLRST